MIKIDFSKAVPQRFGTYLLGLIPGVFFESSIAIGNPHFAVSVMSRLNEIYSFGPYSLLALFVASSLFIGSGFFLAAWIAQRLVFFGFVMWRYMIRATFGSEWLYRRFATLQGIPPKQTVFIRVLSKLIFWARERQFSTAARPVLKCLHTATERLLKERYGIKAAWRLQKDGSDWGVWYSVLGKPLIWAQEEMLSSRTLLGCGLAGFTALYAAPALRERYFVALCCAFALPGLFVSWELALWNFNAVRRSMLQLKSILLELSESTSSTNGKKPTESQSGLIATKEADHDE